MITGATLASFAAVNHSALKSSGTSPNFLITCASLKSPVAGFRAMKFVTPSNLADPDLAARRLVEIANTVEAVQNGRIYIELINGPFLKEGGTPDQYCAALASAVAHGWLLRHESGTYVKFTTAGAEA